MTGFSWPLTVRFVGLPILSPSVLTWSPWTWKSLSATTRSLMPRSDSGRYFFSPSTMMRPDIPPAV